MFSTGKKGAVAAWAIAAAAIIAAALLIQASAIPAAPTGQSMLETNLEQPLVCFAQKCLAVEIAHTPEELSRGLMYRENLAENAGMLFIFGSEERQSFWMKNTKIPLDMIWMDAAGEIIFIKENAQPCATLLCESYGPNADAKFVLEANAGFAQKNNLTPGDKAEFKNIPREEALYKILQERQNPEAFAGISAELPGSAVCPAAIGTDTNSSAGSCM